MRVALEGKPTGMWVESTKLRILTPCKSQLFVLWVVESPHSRNVYGWPQFLPRMQFVSGSESVLGA